MICLYLQVKKLTIIYFTAEGSLVRKRKAQDKLKDIEVGLQPPPPKRLDIFLPFPQLKK